MYVWIVLLGFDVGYKMLLRQFTFTTLLLLFVPWSVGIASAHKLTFSHIEGSPIHAKGAVVLTELYRRLKIDVSFMKLPGLRALKMSNSGKTDGEVFRIWEAGITHKNLLRIPTPLLTLNGYAFSLKTPVIDNFQQLDDVQRIGIQRGIIWAESYVGPRKGIVRVTTVSELVDKLLAGAIDVALATEDGVETEIRRRNLNMPLYVGTPIITFNVYHYLHKRNKNLVDRVDKEIRKMLVTNEIEKISKFPFHNIN